MLRRLSFFLPLAAALSAEAPSTKRSDFAETLHGVWIEDPYRWLEDSNSEETRRWVQAQSGYARVVLDQQPGRAAIAKRLEELTRVTSSPISYGVAKIARVAGKLFFERLDPGADQPVLYVQRTGESARALVDPNLGEKTSLSSWSPSPDGQWLAYGVALAGSDWQAVRVRNVDSGKDLPDRIEWSKATRYEWTADSRGFYYTRFAEPPKGEVLTAANFYQKLYLHKLRTPQSSDALIYHRPDQKEWSFRPYALPDGTLLLAVGWGTRRQNLLLLVDPRKTAAAVELTAKFQEEFQPLGIRDGRLLLRTSDSAPKGRVVSMDLASPGRDRWREVVSESADTLERAVLWGPWILCQHMRDVKSVLGVYSKSGARQHEVTLPSLGTAAWQRGEFAAESHVPETEAYYAFGSYTQPLTLFRYLPAKRQATPLFESKLPFDTAQFETRQVFYPSKDGARIPMFLVHKRGLRPNGDTPVLLYGYGGFNLPTRPNYVARTMAWVEMGGIFASANLRGGSEYGSEWHRAGALDKKQNVFDDFIAAAEYLIRAGYTKPSRLAIYGRSNGGLLVGACLNQRPDLFGAAVPAVGVMDMLRFHQFTVGTGWTSDYGSPDNPKDFETLRKYSPLHNIRQGTKYPPTLVITADHDDRVVPLHSFKYGAALQHAQEGSALILIRIDTDSGHGGGKPLSKVVEEDTDVIAFLRHALGVN